MVTGVQTCALPILSVEKKGDLTPLEHQISNIISELAKDNKELENLKITGVKEVQIEGINVRIIEVPYKQIAAYKKIQVTLIPELEKKLDNSQVVIVAKRRAFPKTPESGRRYQAIRGVKRTLKNVQEALLDDVVYPTAIVAKRVHFGKNGKQTTYVTLDANDKTRVEDRLKTFAAAYGKLTGLKTVFEIAAN